MLSSSTTFFRQLKASLESLVAKFPSCVIFFLALIAGLPCRGYSKEIIVQANAEIFFLHSWGGDLDLKALGRFPDIYRRHRGAGRGKIIASPVKKFATEQVVKHCQWELCPISSDDRHDTYFLNQLYNRFKNMPAGTLCIRQRECHTAKTDIFSSTVHFLNIF